MAKKSEKKTLPAFKVEIKITPLNGEFLDSVEPTVFSRFFTHYLAPISILEMAHFQYSKNAFLDKDNMSKLNTDGKA